MTGTPTLRNAHAALAAWAPLTLAALMAWAQWSPGAFDTLVFSRSAIAAGEFWRLITGHFVHLGFQHFAWNVGTFVAMALVARHAMGIGYGRQMAQAAFIGVFVSAVLWFSGPTVSAYSGLSAILNGLLAPMLYANWQQTRDPSTFGVAAVSLAKIAYEAATGNTLFVDVAWPASAHAHAAGLGAGGLLVVGSMTYQDWRARKIGVFLRWCSPMRVIRRSRTSRASPT